MIAAMGSMIWSQNGYSALVNPLTRLLKKGQLFHWRNEQETAFSDLKQKRTNSEILRFPKYDLTFRIPSLTVLALSAHMIAAMGSMIWSQTGLYVASEY
jgi:hypothetical protein